MNVFLSPGHLAFLTKAELGLRGLVEADLGSLADHGGTSCDASVVDAARRAEASLGALAAVEERLTALSAPRAQLDGQKPHTPNGTSFATTNLQKHQATGDHLNRNARDQAIRADLEAGRSALDVAADVGLSRERIYQIRDSRR
ncbi:hypothetical protein [Streptomyces rubiginosohelvolus]|uniref:hypothetical protein n=1 Tax=Streptomyces rubiginosohelvolus TaxID=67362 RepID=UPI00167C340D|nr:hypothetical protein [Streptomyces pluricolorescens]